jgi:hypothetical protein
MTYFFCEEHDINYTGYDCPICFPQTITVKKGEASFLLSDPINHPKHYCNHPSGVECIQITEHMNFCLGNAIKYIWRAGEKYQDKDIEDLEKSVWYLAREIERRKKAKRGN